MFGGKLGIPELLILLVIALIFFGPSKLAELGKGLGEGIKGFGQRARCCKSRHEKEYDQATCTHLRSPFAKLVE